MTRITARRRSHLLFALATLALSSHRASAFSSHRAPSSSSSSSSSTFLSAVPGSANDVDDSPWSSSSYTSSLHSRSRRRRDVISSITNVPLLLLGGGVVAPQLLTSRPANAGLLEEYGSDPKETDKKKVRELAKDKGKPESNVEPNLRSNYYYPTNKVRYLPRIKKCSDAIPLVALSIGNEDWDAVRDFANVVADDAILPMKLYVSSLTGGGTNVKVGFAKDMMNDAKNFEKGKSDLVKGIEKKDVTKCSVALENMAEAMLAYRTSGRLLGPDGGGDIPSVDEIRRSTKRFRGEAFEAKVKERDARVKAAMMEEAEAGK